MTEPRSLNNGRSGRGIAAKAFWKNPEIPLLSRVLFVVMLGLIPAGYVIGAYYVTPQDCVQQTQRTYALLLGILACYSAYVWIIDRPIVLRAVRLALASKRLQIRRTGWSYEVDDGTPNVRSISVGWLVFMSIGSLLILPWCFWDPIVVKACGGRLRGSPSIALLMLGTTFMLVVIHQVLLWGYLTMSIWRASG